MATGSARRPPPGARLPSSTTGLSLAELLIALALALCAVAVVLPLVAGGLTLAVLQPEVADLDQRLRVTSTMVRSALEQAGAGPAAGEDQGALALRIPPVFPQRRGATVSDPPESAWADRITLVAARAGAVAASLAVPMATAGSPLSFDTGPPCPPLDGRCGLRVGQMALVDDRTGAFDLLRLSVVEPGVLAGAPATLSRAYGVATGARVLPVEVRQLRFDADRRQLRLGDGHGPDLPFIDDVVGLACEYLGDPRPPVTPRPPLGESSCLFGADGVALLPELAGAVGGLVRLSLGALSDGPFCGAGAARYDADLLRIRRVVVKVRLAPASRQGAAADRSPLSTLSQSREVVVDVSLRNLPHAS